MQRDEIENVEMPVHKLVIKRQTSTDGETASATGTRANETSDRP